MAIAHCCHALTAPVGFLSDVPTQMFSVGHLSWCWVGLWYRYVPIFLKTAAFSGVDVLMIGDTKLVTFPQLPPNVRQIHITWEQLVGLVSTRVFDGRPLPQLLTANRYKVVDLKPAYGVLFREHIAVYEFWCVHVLL